MEIFLAESAPCPQGLPPMSEALHAVVAQAEKRAGDGDTAGAASVLTGYIEAHPGETHPYPYYEAGYFLHQAGKRDAAVDYLQKAEWFVALAHALMDADREKEALGS